MNQFINSTLAVTGAGGHLGRRTIELLLEAGARHVVGITRDPAKLADLADRGVELRAASFDDRDTLPAALAGVDRLLIISTDKLGLPGARIGQHTRAIEAAETAGVSHLVYTSVTSPYPDRGSVVPNDHFWTEVRLAAGKLDWTSLRNNQYTDYLIPGARHAIEMGTLFHAAGPGRRAYVTREDCAAAAAGALLRAEGSKIYDVSGPEALSMPELAARFAEVSDRPVAAQSVTGTDLAAAYVKGGVPETMADILVRFDTDTAKGYLGIVTGAVEELSGRPAQSVTDFLAANRPALGL